MKSMKLIPTNLFAISHQLPLVEILTRLLPPICGEFGNVWYVLSKQKPLADYDDGAMVVKSNWLQSQIYAQQFWRRWLAEYLPSLTCRTKWFEKSKPLTVGDLVVVVDPSSPRNVWPRGKVLETTVAKDGQVRRANIKTTCGVLERPVAKLALLDVEQNRE
ncbi:hypothetical protein CVS40_11923 [Lucilia cuprina]|nr:hypothetical protein CVS40_11923 [Lucilia cuprina]